MSMYRENPAAFNEAMRWSPAQHQAEGMHLLMGAGAVMPIPGAQGASLAGLAARAGGAVGKAVKGRRAAKAAEKAREYDARPWDGNPKIWDTMESIYNSKGHDAAMKAFQSGRLAGKSAPQGLLGKATNAVKGVGDWFSKGFPIGSGKAALTGTLAMAAGEIAATLHLRNKVYKDWDAEDTRRKQEFMDLVNREAPYRQRDLKDVSPQYTDQLRMEYGHNQAVNHYYGEGAKLSPGFELWRRGNYNRYQQMSEAMDAFSQDHLGGSPQQHNYDYHKFFYGQEPRWDSQDPLGYFNYQPEQSGVRTTSGRR